MTGPGSLNRIESALEFQSFKKKIVDYTGNYDVAHGDQTVGALAFMKGRYCPHSWFRSRQRRAGISSLRSVIVLAMKS